MGLHIFTKHVHFLSKWNWRDTTANVARHHGFAVARQCLGGAKELITSLQIFRFGVSTAKFGLKFL